MNPLVIQGVFTVGGNREKGHAGLFIPAHRKITPKGTADISSMITFTAFHNDSRRQADGTYKDNNMMLKMVAWSSKTSDKAQAGDGFAEYLARRLAPGTSFFATVMLQKVLVDDKYADGTVVKEKDGSNKQVWEDQYVLEPGKIPLFIESKSQIQWECDNYAKLMLSEEGKLQAGIPSFDCRPPRWASNDTRDVGDVAAWELIKKHRDTKKYLGGKKFGYFVCWAPEGATLLHTGGGTIEVEAGAEDMTPPGKNVVLAKVGGKTYAECIAMGWTDADMLARPEKFAIFIQSGELKVPAEDMTPPAPQAPEEAATGSPI